MEMRRPKLSQLEMLVAVADAGGFGRAAALLGCTQSRISHAVTTLEQVVGARLLKRSRSGCVPTGVGSHAIARARQILALADGLVTETDAPGLGALVRVACFRSISTHMLPRALEVLAQRYPGMRVDLDDRHEERDAVARAVLQGRADIGIAQRPFAAELVSHPYISDAYVLVLPASLKLPAQVGWHHLNGLPYIQLACPGALDILAQCRMAGFTAQPSRMLHTDSSIVAMVARGIGFSILPHLAVFPAPVGTRLAALPVPARRQFAVVTTPDNAAVSAVQATSRVILDPGVMACNEAFVAGVVSW